MKLLAPDIIKKRWGSEFVICNNEEFCGKILLFCKGAQFSMHFHASKREVFYVLRGIIQLTVIDTTTSLHETRQLSIGEIVEIPRLTPHQIKALTEAEVIEFSTHHEDSDSYRVAPGDSQK